MSKARELVQQWRDAASQSSTCAHRLYVCAAELEGALNEDEAEKTDAPAPNPENWRGAP